MTTLLLGTTAVKMDEPCWGLREVNRPAANGRSLRRVQCISVIRSDRVVEFQRDLGAAAQFTASEITIPGGVKDSTGRGECLHTVGELVDIAEYIRLGPYQPPERPKGTDLIKAYRDQPDIRRRWRKKISQFGPAARIERN